MTCVVGIETAKGVLLGGDMASSGEDGELLVQSKADSKVFRCGEFVVGTSSSARFANLLRFVVKWPSAGRLPNDHETLRFAVTKLVPAIRKAFEKEGLRQGSGPHDDHDEGEALLGIGGRLLHLQSDFSIEHPRHRYWAIGSGAGVALGALFVANGVSEGNREALVYALRAAHAHSTHVRPPFSFVEG